MKSQKTLFSFFILVLLTNTVKSENKSYSCRLIDYGADMGAGYYNNKATTAQTTYKEDVDGDGSSTDDCIAFWEYKDGSNYLSPLSSTAITYDNEATNARFYGGIAAFYNKTGISLTEGMLNNNHELRDDWNLMSVHSSSGLMERAYGFWFWNKADFLNGGSAVDNKVTFDANSSISVSNFRLSTNFPVGRWVVRDGNQFYISEAKFGTTQYSATESFTITKYSTQSLHPNSTNWALYNPVAPYDVRFKNPESATYTSHTFTDITAVGFYVARDLLSAGNTQLKWHAFEVNAVVTRPETPSYYTDMTQIPAGGSVVNPFYINTKEITFEQWEKVYRWAVSNQHCNHDDITKGGYVFDKDGDMGSMDVGDEQHTAYEPATDMTWYDAVLWCNALSELEGLTPCYYSDAAKTKILKTIKDRTDASKYTTKFDIYVDYSQNGYRLPTLEEWNAAAGSASSGWTNTTATKEVGTSTANNYGLFDMIGNVWEYCWDIESAGDMFNSATQTSHIVLGGAFNGITNNPTIPVKKWGDLPYKGNPNIGFRVVRHDNGIIPPATQNYASRPNWTITAGDKLLPQVAATKVSNIMQADLQLISGTKTYKTVGDPLYENDNTGYIRTDDAVITITPFRMSKYETSYEKWREILNWAEIEGGYTFDGDGDMGAMDYRVGEISHDKTEPVTEPNWNDVILWCNALSEYEGKTPVYYSDEARTIVLKKGLQWRIAMEQRYSGYPTYTNTMYYARYEKDGYRLPTSSEWEVAYRSGTETKAAAGVYPTSIGSSKNLSNSENNTWDVTSGTPNSLGLFNLHGNVSEYTSGSDATSYYLNHNPKDANTEGLFGLIIKGGNFGTDYQQLKDSYNDKASATRYWVGLRVLRCDENEHPENEVFSPDVKIDVDPVKFNPLVGRTFRNNLMRTGEFTKSGVSTSGVAAKWIFTSGAAITSSPVVVDGVMYIGSDDNSVYALNANTGAQIWKYTTGDDVRSSATVTGDSLFIGSYDGYLYCLKTTDGSLIWQKKAYTSGDVKACPTVAYNTVFATWHGMFEATNTVGLDIKTGTEKWRYRRARANEGAICADATRLFFASSDNVIEGADMATEQTVFYKTGDHNKGSMTVLDDNTVLYAKETAIQAVDKSTGTLLWTTNVGIGADQDLSPLTTPAVANVSIGGISTKMIYWATLKNSIMALRANGTQLWHRKDFTSPFNSAPVVSQNVVYVGSDDNKMYALNAEDGTTIWSYTTGGTIQTSPWIEDGVVYFSSIDGKVYAIQSDTVSASHNIMQDEVKIYPNPVVDNLIFNSDEDVDYVKIINSIGQIIEIRSENGLKSVPVNLLSKGVYTIELYSKKAIVAKSVFIKK